MPKLAHLKFNDPAPDLELLTTEGKLFRLSSLWEKQTLVLAFTRHFGCPQCKEMTEQLVMAKPQLEAHGLILTFVTQGRPEQARAFCEERAAGVLCLADPKRAAYAAYGLGRGTTYQTLLSPRVWKSNRRLKETKGWAPESPPKGQDAFVMSGTFIIGTDGRIHLPYYYEDITDHPPVGLLLHGVMGVDWSKPIEGPIKPESRETKNQ